mmetsp:Transcript_12578/g.40527  ORF Transcript_12578/g.40527 Transcript_12578/m.40527 type:complete len:249 (+) Transcript_12578:59-805(+)
MRGQPRLLLRRVDDLLARPLAKGPLSHQPVHLANRDGVEHRAQGLLIERRVPHAHVVQVTVERVLARQAAQMHLSLGVTLALVALSDHLEMVTQRAVEVQPELVPVIHTGNVGPLVGFDFALDVLRPGDRIRPKPKMDVQTLDRVALEARVLLDKEAEAGFERSVGLEHQRRGREGARVLKAPAQKGRFHCDPVAHRLRLLSGGDCVSRLQPRPRLAHHRLLPGAHKLERAGLSKGEALGAERDGWDG